jgi:hypothetical protein
VIVGGNVNLKLEWIIYIYGAEGWGRVRISLY